MQHTHVSKQWRGRGSAGVYVCMYENVYMYIYVYTYCIHKYVFVNTCIQQVARSRKCRVLREAVALAVDSGDTGAVTRLELQLEVLEREREEERQAGAARGGSGAVARVHQEHQASSMVLSENAHMRACGRSSTGEGRIAKKETGKKSGEVALCWEPVEAEDVWGVEGEGGGGDRCRKAAGKGPDECGRPCVHACVYAQTHADVCTREKRSG